MIKLNGIILFVLICITSCTKKTEDATDVSSIASDDGFAENIIYDLKNAGDQAGTYELSPTIKSFEKSKDTCLGVKFMKFDTITKSGTLVVSYGKDGKTNCTCKDGKTRRGSIEINYQPTKNIIGSVITYRTDSIQKNKDSDQKVKNEYFVNDNQLIGYKKVTLKDARTFEINVKDAKIIKKDGGMISWSSDRVRLWTAGYDTPDIKDDSYEITGTSYGINSNNIPYSFSTITALEKSTLCQWIKKGKLKITRTGKKDAIIDYGDGACDNKAILTVGTWTKEILVKSW